MYTGQKKGKGLLQIMIGFKDKRSQRKWGTGIKVEKWGPGDDDDQVQRVAREVVAKKSKNRNQAGQGSENNCLMDTWKKYLHKVPCIKIIHFYLIN